MFEPFDTFITDDAEPRIESARTGFEAFDIPVATRISIAMVLATALFKDWLFDDSSPVSDDRIVEELTQIWLHGTKRTAPKATGTTPGQGHPDMFGGSRCPARGPST